MIRPLVPFSIFACSLFFLSGYGQQADFVLYNAKVYTMNSTFETREAMAVKKGRILELGNSASLLSKYKDAKDRRRGRPFTRGSLTRTPISGIRPKPDQR
jgi:hypothetical protein